MDEKINSGSTCSEHRKLSESLDKMSKDISDIKKCLIGDIDGSQGLYSKVVDLEKRVVALETFANQIKAKVSGVVYKVIFAALSGGLLTIGLDKLIK